MKKRRSYKFTNRKHPEAAIMSVVLGIISLISLCIVIYLSYAAGGDAQPGFGFTGVLALIFALIGVILGALTVNDKRNYKLFPITGIVLNMLVFAVLGLIIHAGSSF